MITDLLRKTSEAIFSGSSAASFSNTKLEKAKEALTSEYHKNLAALEAEKSKTAGEYSLKLNTAAASSENLARSFDERASSSGLNDGAGKNAALIRDYMLRERLKSIESSRREAIAKIEERKAKLKGDYISELEKAEAEAEKQRLKEIEKANRNSSKVLSKASNLGVSTVFINKARNDEYRLSEQYEKLRDDTLEKLGLGGKKYKGF